MRASGTSRRRSSSRNQGRPSAPKNTTSPTPEASRSTATAWRTTHTAKTAPATTSTAPRTLTAALLGRRARAPAAARSRPSRVVTSRRSSLG